MRATDKTETSNKNRSMQWFLVFFLRYITRSTKHATQLSLSTFVNIYDMMGGIDYLILFSFIHAHTRAVRTHHQQSNANFHFNLMLYASLVFPFFSLYRCRSRSAHLIPFLCCMQQTHLSSCWIFFFSLPSVAHSRLNDAAHNISSSQTKIDGNHRTNGLSERQREMNGIHRKTNPKQSQRGSVCVRVCETICMTYFNCRLVEKRKGNNNNNNKKQMKKQKFK